jgi:hypothetical protein
LTNATVFYPELAAANRRELVKTNPTYIVDGLGPLNPALAIGNYPDLKAWLHGYREIGRTPFSVVYVSKSTARSSRPDVSPGKQ